MKGNFHSFVRKESLHILRDKRTMLIVILIPVVLMVLFGFAISTEVNNVNVAVCVPCRTAGTRDAVERISRNPVFTFRGYVDNTEIDEALRSGKADAVVVFDADYDRKRSQISSGLPCSPAIQLVMDASNVNMVGAATSYLQSVLSGTSSSQNIFETRMLFNPQMKSSYNFVPGIMGMIFILVCAIMTSVSIVREREVGTMEVLLVSPARPLQIIIAKMIPYFGISCVVLFTILVLAKYLLGLPMSGGVGGVIAISLLYLVLSLAIGLLVSNVAKTQIMALLMSAMVMMIPTMMLSGMLFPIENLPKFFQLLSCAVPTRYYIDAVRKMMIQGVSIAVVWQDCLILLGMTVAVLGVSLKKFNDRLE